MEIRHNDDGKKGAFEAYDANGTFAGDMTYTWAGDQRFIADHTGVEDAFAGQGVGMHLFEALVAFAREKSVKVIPLCPYVKSRFDKLDNYRDVL